MHTDKREKNKEVHGKSERCKMLGVSQNPWASDTAIFNTRKNKSREHDRESKREKTWGKEKSKKEGIQLIRGKQKGQVEKTGRKGKEGEKEERMRESDRQKGREISAGTVTNKSLQHDRRLLKHFISPQHNGVLLPIICSVSARVDIK